MKYETWMWIYALIGLGLAILTFFDRSIQVLIFATFTLLMSGIFNILSKIGDYKQGFNDGLNACKPNKKLDKAVKKGIEL